MYTHDNNKHIHNNNCFFFLLQNHDIVVILSLLALALICPKFTVINALEREMTISVEPGTRECFYENVKIGEIIDIEYQVIDGGHGDLDTSFELSEPSGRILYADFKKSDNVHRHKVVNVAGDYKFCFDNSFSRMNRKTIFFEVIIENEDGTQDDSWSNDILEGLTQEEFYDMKVEDIQNVVNRVRQHLTKARQTQELLKSFEARDRNMAEENYFRVNTWSLFQMILMVAVGCFQVFMVKSLFNTDSKMGFSWQKLSPFQ